MMIYIFQVWLLNTASPLSNKADIFCFVK